MLIKTTLFNSVYYFISNINFIFEKTIALFQKQLYVFEKQIKENIK
jgi:hypothetical protein